MKRRFFVNDDLAEEFYEIGRVFDDLFPFNRYSFSGQIIDTDKYDIVPKQSYYEEKIKRSEEEIEALDRQHKSDEIYYQERRKRLVEQKEYFLREKEKKKLDKP